MSFTNTVHKKTIINSSIKNKYNKNQIPMTQETENLLIDKLTAIQKDQADIKMMLAESTREETDTDGACEILLLKNPRQLKTLRDLGHLTKWTQRGKKYSYNKAELMSVKLKLDSGEIRLLTLKSFR